MNKNLKQLIELSSIDKEIDNFSKEEDKINEALKEFKYKKRILQNSIEKIDQELDELKSKKSKSDILIQDLADKLKETDKKTAVIKTEKELKALQLEEGIAKEQINELNEDIARLDKIYSGKEDAKKQIQEEIEKIDESIKQEEETTGKKLKDLEKRKQTVFDKRDKHTKDFPQKLLTFYQKIRRWAGSTSVVPVKKQACYGCFLKLNDKVYSELLRSDEIVNCPHCGRILYIERTEEKA